MSDTGTTQTTTPPAWYAGLDAEHVGHVQARGWDKLEPSAAALEAVRGHVAATRMIGVPADQLLRLPKEATDSDGWKQVYQRLGAPADPKDYSFDGVKIGDDSVTASFLDAMRGAAAAANMPKQMAAAVAQSVQGWVNDRVTAHDTMVADNIAQANQAIKQSWGENFAAFSVVAERGRKALEQRLGETLAPQVEQAVEMLNREGFGHLAVEMMRVMGFGLGEDKFIRDTSGSGRPAMTREMAVARQQELMTDRAWAARYVAGDQEARHEMKALNRIVAGE